MGLGLAVELDESAPQVQYGRPVLRSAPPAGRLDEQSPPPVIPEPGDVARTGVPPVGVPLAAEVAIERDVRVSEIPIVPGHEIAKLGVNFRIFRRPVRHGSVGVLHIPTEDEGHAVGFVHAIARRGRIVVAYDVPPGGVLGHLPVHRSEEGEGRIVIGFRYGYGGVVVVVGVGVVALLLRVPPRVGGGGGGRGGCRRRRQRRR